jgi:hypothetical protein
MMGELSLACFADFFSKSLSEQHLSMRFSLPFIPLEPSQIYAGHNMLLDIFRGSHIRQAVG